MKKGLERKRIENGSAEWLADRQKSIGGSDAAAICGLSEYRSPYSVWQEKTGQSEPVEDNEAMRQGRDLEAYVAKRFAEATGKKVRRENAVLRDPNIPFAHANVDRMVDGEDAILECKTTSALNLAAFKNGEYPPYYYAQVMHYLLVTGAKKAYIAVIVLGKEFHIFEVERDEDEIEALRAAEKTFWDYVDSRTPPPVDGSKATTAALNDMFPDSEPVDIDLTPVEIELAAICQLQAEKKAKEEKIAELQNRVKQYMGTAEKGRSSVAKVSWATQTRKIFDLDAYKAAGMDPGPFMKVSTSRVFKVTPIKKK